MANPIALLLILLAFLPGGPGNPPKDEKDTYRYLKAHFASPPAAYRTAPFWVWNGKETREEIDRQLADYKARGIGGVILHPRPGLITPYLSDEWFALVRHAADRGKALGIEVWLYDENSYPSGFAGGNVPAQMPEAVSQGQGLQLVPMKKLEKVDEYALIFRREGDRLVEASKSEAGREGDYYGMRLINYPNRGWNGGYSYVDLLLPGVTEKFIDVTMRGYEKALGADLGGIVPGIFTDEPNLNPPGGTRYTPDLFEQFKARRGYDLKPHLLALFEEVGDWQRVRHDYQSVLLDLFIDRWSKPWYEYTEKNKIVWTGHYWEHGWPATADGPDNMAMYAWHQMPGIDMLFNTEDTRPDQFGNSRAVKELSSVANQLGRRRTLSETYGGSGWDLRFEDMKRLGGWEYVLGVNFMNQHLSFSTIKGARKRDYPQSFSYHTPWWGQYDELAGYFGRLSLALSSGQQVNTTLVIEPTTSAWMYSAPRRSATRLKEIGDGFESFVDQLEALQVEYDLGSERILRDHAKATDGRFIVGQRSYDLVVLPVGLENLDARTVDLLEEYLKQGGRVLAFVDAPARVDGAVSDRLSGLQQRYTKQWTRAEAPANALEHLAAKDFRIDNPGQFGGKLFHHRRRLDQGQVLFLTNYSKTEGIEGRFSIAGKSVERLDPFTGEMKPYAVRSEGRDVSMSFRLEAGGSLLLFVHDAGTPFLERAVPPTRVEKMNGSPVSVRRLEKNVLTLDFVDYKVAGSERQGVFYTAATDSIFRKHGFENYGIGFNPWNGAVQYRSAIVDRDHFPAGSGFEATYRFLVADGFTAGEGLELVVEWPHLYRVSVNGKEVKARPGAWWLDRSFGVFDIGSLITAGENRVTLVASPMSVYAELEPVYVRGDFSLEPAEQGFRIVPAKAMGLGSWKSQGMPLYSHSVSYRKTYDVPAGKATYIVRPNEWAGTVAEVRVNGQKAGVLGWKPYEVDVTRLMKPGRNEVEIVVYGGLQNTLGPHHGKLTPGFVSPWSFAVLPAQPAGSAYQSLDYGLFDDFVLQRMISK